MSIEPPSSAAEALDIVERQRRAVAAALMPELAVMHGAWGLAWLVGGVLYYGYAVGLVWNISASGVSMLLADPPGPGEELTGELTAGAAVEGLPVAVRVVHVRPVPTGDYFLGARFARPLSPEELRPFLAPGADPFTPPG